MHCARPVFKLSPRLIQASWVARELVISSGGAGYLKRKEKEKKKKKKKKEAQKVGEGLRNYSWTNAIPLLPLTRRSATNRQDLPMTSLTTYQQPRP